MLVPDASVVVLALTATGEPGDTARAALAEGAPLQVPDLLDLEVVIAVRRMHMADHLDRAGFERAAAAQATLPARRWPARPLLGRIVELASNVTTHDAAYVALAEQLEIPLLTADTRLAAAPGLRCDIQGLD